MPPPWAETQSRVVIEYVREAGIGTRKISFRHSPEVLPAQLHGRITHQLWTDLMRDIIELGKSHPYTQTPSTTRCCGWLGGVVCALATGFCCLNPDGGDYEEWLPQVNTMLDRQRPYFSQAGCNLSLQRAQGSYWVQIDVDAKAMAMGQPVLPAVPGTPGVPGMPPTGYPPAVAPGYPPAQYSGGTY